MSSKSGYEKYVNYKTFSVAVAAFAVLLFIPMPASMLDVAVEYSAGKEHVLNFFTRELFGKPCPDVEQWQVLSARILERNMMQGAFGRGSALKRDLKRLHKMGIEASQQHLEKFRALVQAMEDRPFADMMACARKVRHQDLAYDRLDRDEQARADRAAWNIRVCIAMVAFVVICFLTEAIPLPGVAFCIGLILVFSGVVSREDVASLFWSDACWFIMGSLMFAAAFVKTGVDKRICLVMFRYLARPHVKWITGILILAIAPAASLISDHALAAMFLPIAIILYNNSLDSRTSSDSELSKMLVICIAMACNIGGFGAPSGGARNLIMMTYMEDMFGIDIGYGQWMLFALPFVLIMMPILWGLLNWRFKPRIKSLRPALDKLKTDIQRMGRWNRKQIIAVVIFGFMLFGWITEKNLLYSLFGIRLGIGVIAVAGAVLYLLFGVVNWRDYQDKVDWGVVWLYAGAIIFGRMLDQTGAAYWMARSVVEAMASLGLATGQALLALGSTVTAGLTNLMADGPAAAAVGPITLNMAAISSPNTTLIPFMGLVTAASSSFAYLLVIGTPPNAIVYASGFLQPKDFLRVGVPCFIAAFVVLILLSWLYWPLIGFAGLSPF
jgi:sodium-dependent dicarboxylate transporter 2/3/5